jgi:hypothetical protein
MTVLRSEAREVLRWCLAQPGWWRTRNVALELNMRPDGALKQMRRLDELNLIERGAFNGRTALWRIRDRDHAQTVANEQPKQRNYRKTKPDKSIFSVWSQVNGSRDD